MRALRLLLPLGLAALAAAVLAAAAPAALRGCDPQASLDVDLAAAARTPAIVGGRAGTLGSAGAAALVRELVARASICTGTPDAATRAAAARIRRARGAEAHRLALAALRRVKAMRVRRAAAVRVAAAAAAGGCGIDRRIRVDPHDARKALDAFAVAEAAYQAGDDAAGDAAVETGKAAVNEWGDGALKGASSVGDYLTIEQAAQSLGLDDLASRAGEGARAASRRDLDRLGLGKVDPCTANQNDLRCQVRAVAVAQLLGADSGDETAKLRDLVKAIGDRLDKKIPAGCEEWRFTMEAHDPKTGWGMRWYEGRFRVNRTSGRIEGSKNAGLSQGWPGLIGDNTSDCVEESEEGTINHGPASIRGGGFHYSLDGSVSPGAFSLSVSSDDAKISVTAPASDICQFAAALGEYFLNAFVKGPFPLEFPVAEGQTSSSLDSSDAESEFHARIERVSA